ncbi:MAG: hypothetical protein ACPL5I_05005 [Thermodesulfobacteriota bacterium]
MEKLTPEQNQKNEEKNISSPTIAPEEPIILNELFPQADKDLDALFPDPGLKKLLKDVVKIRQKNEKFLKNLRIEENMAEED